MAYLGHFHLFFQNVPNRFFSKMHGKVPVGSEKPADIVAMLRHFLRVTTVKEWCETVSIAKRSLRSHLTDSADF